MEPTKYLTKIDIRHAIKSDIRFRELFPELATEFADFLHNPTCPCHDPIVNKIMKSADRLKQYFPNKEIQVISEQPKYEEFWITISCHIDELNQKLKTLPVGRKQLSIARFEDQITAVVNMLVQMP